MNRPSDGLRRQARLALLLVSSVAPLLATLPGCASLPASGPTAGRVRKSAESDPMGFRIVDVNASNLQALNAAPRPLKTGLAALARAGRNDAVGPGDVLQISIYEVGASLFGGGVGAGLSGGVDYDASARAASFPPITVDRDGAITLPFIGRMVVAGRTPADIQRMVVAGLAGKSQNPQAVVSVRTNVANRIFVGGDVRKPGPIELTLGIERVSDALALGGGTTYPIDDMVVRLHRGAQTAEERVSDLHPGGPDDIVMLGGDRVELLHRARSFTVFGATPKVSQVAFENSDVSLAEAVARIGGPSDTQADPKAVFLFRYATSVGPNGVVERPVIYRLNMMEPASYFLAQRFAMQDKDVIYIANAALVQPAKFVAIINQLFGPLLTARALTR